MDLGLKGKVAMIGGASKGLGYAVARALAGEGAHVSIAHAAKPAIDAPPATGETASRRRGRRLAR
jgi:3-oxoacyl-[acyl-carrier protein] reductase